MADELLTGEVAALFARARKETLFTVAQGPARTLDRAAIGRTLPHRDPFLFLESVEDCDVERGLVAAKVRLDRFSEIFAGHFPGQPVFPGVLQIEAVAQAGILAQLLKEGESPASLALTHVLGARFMHPVRPGTDLDLRAVVLEDGLMFTIVGQCIQDGRICSAIAVSGVA